MCNTCASKLCNTDHKLIPTAKRKKKQITNNKNKTVTQQTRQTKQPPRKNKTNTKSLTNPEKYKNQVKEAEIPEKKWTEELQKGQIIRKDR